MKKQLFTYAKVFFLLQLLFVVFSIISCLLPNKTIKKNIEKSVEIYHNERLYPQHFIRQPAHQSDNFMDFLIINMIYNTDSKNPFDHFLLPQGHDSYDTTDVVVNHLKFSIENPDVKPNFTYGRYWQGSSFAYRWLFLFSGLLSVKWLNFMFCSLVLFAFVSQLNNSMKKQEMYSVLIGLIFVNYYMVFTSFQFTPVFLIALLGAIFVIKKVRQQRRIDILFLIIGALTCYFDLLTAPILTLGIPILVWIVMQNEVIDVLKKLKTIIGNSILWFFGYIATWVFKWVLISVFTDSSILEEIKNKTMERIGLWKGTRFQAIKANIDMLNLVPLALLLIVAIILTGVYFNKNGLRKATLFLVVAFFPLIWFFATANHVELHNWYTYRTLWVTISGLLLMFTTLIRWNDIKLLTSLKIKKKSV